MDSAVRIKDVVVIRGGQRILDGVSADFDIGQIIGLLGPSGAGKTTLIRTIIGRLQPDSGSVTIFGQPAGSAKLRQDIGFMAQGFGVYPDLTLAENLRYFAAMTGLPAQRAEEVLHDVDLMPQAKQLVSTLSGGQQLRASLAIALLRQPKLLVLDEPTVGLDPVLRQQLWELFRNMARQGATLLISSHIMDEASHCDHLLLLRQGKVLATGTPAELQSRTHSHDMENSFLRLVEASS